jgi:hypothetical protein
VAVPACLARSGLADVGHAPFDSASNMWSFRGAAARGSTLRSRRNGPSLTETSVCRREGVLELVGRQQSQDEVSRSANRPTAASSNGRSLVTVAATIECDVSK